VLLELLLPLLLPSLPPLLLLLLVLDALLVALLLLLPDLKFFRNPDFSVLRNGGQALMDAGQALCHNRNFKIQKHVQRREDKVWDHFSESVFWCFLGGGFYLFFISRLNGNVF
jgi:hypothetical protein